MSANIFAFSERADFKNLLEEECKDLDGFTLTVKSCVKEFEALLDLFANVEMIIIDPPLDINRYAKLQIILKDKESSIKNVLVLAKTPTGPQDLFSHLKKIVKQDDSIVGQYISISLESFIHFKMLPFDLYIKLSEGRFVKRILAMEDIDESMIKSLQEKGVSELHFLRKFNRDFSLMLFNNMINKVESNYSSVDAKNKAASEVFFTTKEIVQSVGLPLKVIQVCESVMESITNDVTRSKDKFSSYLNGIKSPSELSFQFRFVELTSFIATQMVEALGDGNNIEHVKTIVFSAFFCDISLKEEYVEIRSEEATKDVWPADRDGLFDHSIRASEILKKYKNAPPEALTIIRQHHGCPNGIGFPKVCDNRVLPISKCLIASQELAFALMKNSDRPTDQVIAEVVKKFEGSPIHPYLIFFESSCNEVRVA
jgi:hypothetical protein